MYKEGDIISLDFTNLNLSKEFENELFRITDPFAYRPFIGIQLVNNPSRLVNGHSYYVPGKAILTKTIVDIDEC